MPRNLFIHGYFIDFFRDYSYLIGRITYTKMQRAAELFALFFLSMLINKNLLYNRIQDTIFMINQILCGFFLTEINNFYNVYYSSYCSCDFDFIKPKIDKEFGIQKLWSYCNCNNDFYCKK